MTEFQREFISLIKSAVLGEEAQISANFNFERAYDFALDHQIVPIVYYALINNDSFNSSAISKQFFSDTCLMITRSENQRIENEKIFTAFDENGIEYMPFKGAVIKDIYPYPEMRVMADTDVLVKAEKMKHVNRIMKKLGFTFYSEGRCDRCFKKDKIISIEVHKRLFSPEIKDLYSYFGDGWQRTQKAEKGSMYEFSHEDNYIYLFLHFTKHYRNGGIGIRHALDLFMYKMTYDLDMDYIAEKINSVNLGEFYNNTEELLGVWFENKDSNEKIDFITNYIFSSGSFGDIKNHALSNALRVTVDGETNINKIKRKNIFSVLFPKYENMKLLYHVLEKAPILLPVMWIVRIFNRMFTRKDAVKRNLRELKESNKFITDENIENYKNSLSYVGLGFEFDFEE